MFCHCQYELRIIHGQVFALLYRYTSKVFFLSTALKQNEQVLVLNLSTFFFMCHFFKCLVLNKEKRFTTYFPIPNNLLKMYKRGERLGFCCVGYQNSDIISYRMHNIFIKRQHFIFFFADQFFFFYWENFCIVSN